MCPALRLMLPYENERCVVCRRFLHPTDNDFPFCSPTCRRIDTDTSVLLLTGPPEEVTFNDNDE